MATVLVTGICGSLARLAAMELVRQGHEVVGADYRPKPVDHPLDVAFVQANYNKTRIADVFRRHRPQRVLHLGRVGNLKVTSNKRFDLNVVGSAKIQELAVEYEVERLVVMSTFHIYGAHPHNHVPIYEDEPLRAMQTVPQLADAVQLDNQAVAWTFRHRKLRTIVLRPTNVVGPQINNTISRYLRLPRIPYLLGFNPMWQFVYQDDMVRALLLALEGDQWGVFNVAGRGSAPVVEAFALTGSPTVPVPGPMVKLYSRLLMKGGPARIPTYLIDFLRYPVIISDGKFRETFEWEPKVGIPEAIRATVNRRRSGWEPSPSP